MAPEVNYPANALRRAGADPAPWLLLALAVAMRSLVAMRTEMPARDGVSYLWMAERIAGGEITAGFDGVFHPVYPLLVAPLLALWPALDPVIAGQLVAGVCGALAVLPLYLLARRTFGVAAARAAGFFYAIGVWFARFPADCLSEGVFYLLVATAMAALSGANLTRRHGVVAGLAAGLAYGTRPEGLWLLLALPWLWGKGARAAMVALGLAFLAAALPWPLGWAAFGDGFTVTPKLGFNLGVGVAAEGAGASHYFHHLLNLPLVSFEVLGYVAVPLAILGLWSARPLRRTQMTTLMLMVLAVQLLAIPLLRSHYRFVSGYGLLLLVFSGGGWQRVRPRVVRWSRWLVVVYAVIAAGGDLVRLPQARRVDRVVLRDLGVWLSHRLEPGERIATEMPRLEFFAGQRPGPPRPILRGEILEACTLAATRYAVVVAPRTGLSSGDLLAAGFEPVSLPAGLAVRASARHVLVYQRKPQ